MGNISRKNYIKSSNICRETSYSFTVKTGLFPITALKLFPLSGDSAFSINEGFEHITVNIYRDGDFRAYQTGDKTITLPQKKVVSGYVYSVPQFILEKLNTSANNSRVFNQKVYPEDFLTFENTEASVGLSRATMTLDLSGFNYNSGEDWSTQTKIYIMKITTTGVNGTGEFILRSFPLIENNDDYLTASGQSLYSESLPVYINTSGNICFHGSNISTLCNCSDITALWAESRRKDPDVYDDFISLVLDDANTLELYDYYYPFQPTKEKTIILTNNTQQCTWITDYIYVLEDGLELAKITKSTEARVSITSTITTEDKVLVAHPDQDYVYLIGETEQQVIDVLDDSVTTTTHDFSGYTDLMPLFDKDGNLWFSGDKYAKANMSSLYSHSVDAFCNYNFLIDSNNEYYDLDGNTLNPDVLTATIDIATYSEVTGAIKRYPQTYLFPYNQTDITQMYNQDIWFDSTGTEYDGSTNAYQIPASGEVTIEDGIKVIVDDNDGYDQVVEGDYFYFVVSGKGIVVDDWTDADLKLSFAPWDYEEYTKSIVVVDTEYNIEEKPDPDFVDLNYHVISGTWDDGTEIVFTTSSPGIGEVQLKVDDWCYGVCPYRTMYAYNSNYGTGEVVFNVEDIGRTATITYNVGYTR